MMIRGFFSSLIVFVLVLIVFDGLTERSAASQTVSTIDSQETDQLFRDLGVLKIPRILPPVDFELMDLNNRFDE